MSTPITLVPGTLPDGYCYPPDPQQLNVDIVTRITAFLAMTLAGVYASPTPPPIDQRDKLWFNTNVQRLYQWVNGNWMRQYLPGAGNGEIRMINVSVDTYNQQEGGDPVAMGVDVATGPLWIAEPTMEGAVPVGVGTFPGTSPAVTVALGATMASDGGVGEYKHTLTIDEIPVHNHALQVFDGPVTAGTHPQAYIGTTSQGTFNTNDVGGGLAHVNMPPFRGVHFVKRTTRIYVVSPF